MFYIGLISRLGLKFLRDVIFCSLVNYFLFYEIYVLIDCLPFILKIVHPIIRAFNNLSNNQYEKETVKVGTDMQQNIVAFFLLRVEDTAFRG
jgi:hypothetical protein